MRPSTWILTAILSFGTQLGCGGEDSDASEETTESDDESTESENGSEDESESGSEEPTDELDGEEEVDEELAIDVEEHTLDEETREAGAAETRGIAHILVRYRGGDRTPSSVTRTEAEAETRANEALGRIEAGETFADVAADVSDDEANRESGGAMGSLERGLLPSALDSALFSMEVGGTQVVQTNLGYHVVRRTR